LRQTETIVGKNLVRHDCPSRRNAEKEGREKVKFTLEEVKVFLRGLGHIQMEEKGRKGKVLREVASFNRRPRPKT